MKYFFQKKIPEIIIILGNIILAGVIIANPSNTINADGILYLQTAQAYWTNGWHAAIQLYPWPFYPVLIAWIAHLFHSSLEIPAYGLNIFFQTLICLGFFYIACEIKGVTVKDRPNNFYIYATIITILFFPVFNHIRDLIVRDFGYWAASMWAWLALIQFCKTKKSYRGLQFGVLMLIAGLFRLEGFVMLLLGPFAVWCLKATVFYEKFKLFLIANTVTLVSAVCLILSFLLFSHDIHQIGRLLDFKAQIYSGMNNISYTFSQAKDHLAHFVLTTLSVDSATTLLAGALCILYFKMLITTLSPLYTLLFGFAQWKKQFSPISEAKPVLFMAIVLNLVITSIFLLQNLFLTYRYLMALCFLLLLWVPHAAVSLRGYAPKNLTVTKRSFPRMHGDKLAKNAPQDDSNWWISRIIPSLTQGQTLLMKPGLVLLLIITIGTISLWDFGVSRAYLKEAGYWIQNSLPNNAKIYTNSIQVQFYAKKPLITFDNKIALEHIKTSDYQYLAFQISSNNRSIIANLNQYFIKPVKIFRNSKNDGIWIYVN